MAWTTYTTLKTLEGIPAAVTTYDAMLQALIPQAETAIKRYCGRDFDQTIYPGVSTDGTGDGGFYSGDGTRSLLLRQRPVVSITSVYLDSAGRWGTNADGFDSTTLLVAGTDYSLRYDGYLGSAKCSYCGILERIGATWPATRWYTPGALTLDLQPGQGNVKVSYVAGWTTVPSDVVQALALTVAYWRRIGAKGGNIASESQGAYSYSMAGAIAAGLPVEARELLARYKELSFA